MTCQQYEADLVDLARGVLEDGDVETPVRRHLAACEACAARFDRERRLTTGFRALSVATTVPANDIAERRLMEAFAAERGASSSPERRAPVMRWAALAAAACVLFFLGAWAAVEWRGRTLAPAGAGAPVRAAAPASTDQPGPVERVASAAAPAPVVAKTGRGPAPRGDRVAAPSELPEDTDQLAGFIPLPAADGFPGFDSGMIVRVALPTASLPAYGLAIAPEATETVNADLLVGQDGRARAIRLVSLVGGSRRDPQ